MPRLVVEMLSFPTLCQYTKSQQLEEAGSVLSLCSTIPTGAAGDDGFFVLPLFFKPLGPH